MFDEILIAVYLILVGALFGGMIKDVSLDKIRDENLVLKAANSQLKEQVKELDYKQAKLTKKIAELNGIGGYEMKEKYERLKDIAATYGYDKVVEETEKKLVISNGYFHELRILCDDVKRKFGMKIVNKVYDSTIFTIITFHYGEFLMEFEKTLKININRVFKESMRMINLDV